MLSDATREELAADLAAAEESRVATTPLTDRHADIDVVDAYEIQLINIRRRVRAGTTVIGHKVGLSSEAMQKMMGVDEPDYGHLLADMEVFEDVAVPAEGSSIPASRSRWDSSSPTTCPEPDAPRTTSWRPPPRSFHRSN